LWRVTRLSGRGKAWPSAAGFLSSLGYPGVNGTQGFGLLGFASSKRHTGRKAGTQSHGSAYGGSPGCRREVRLNRVTRQQWTTLFHIVEARRRVYGTSDFAECIWQARVGRKRSAWHPAKSATFFRLRASFRRRKHERQAMRCFMSRYLNSVRKFLVSEDGPTAVEYAVMLALIIVVCLAAIGTIGTNANTTFTNVGTSLAGT